MISKLLCVFHFHDTHIYATDQENQIRCRRCDQVLERWAQIRPEQQHRAARLSQAEQDRRAAWWRSVEPPLRFRKRA